MMKKLEKRGKGKQITAMALAVMLALGSVPAVRAAEVDDVSVQESQAEETVEAVTTAETATAAENDGAYDVTPPVINGVTFEEDGQTVEQDSELHFLVDAYDAESELDTEAYVIFTYDSPTYSRWGNIQQTDDGYLLTITSPYTPGKYSLRSIVLYDTYQNRAELEIEGTFTVSGDVIDYDREELTGTLTLSDSMFTLDSADDIAELGIEIKLDAEAPDDINRGYMTFYTNGEGYYQNLYIDLTYDAEKKALIATKEIDSSYKGGDWYSSYAYAYSDTESYYIRFDKTSFTLENSYVDVTAPTIKNISIDKQGEFVASGEVTITIEAEDNNELRENASLRLYSPLGDQIKNSTYYVELTYDKEKGAYIGSINVDELYPCEWYIDYFYIYDTADNETYYSGHSDQYAHYFYVKKSGDTFVQKSYKNITFYLTFQDGTTHTIQKEYVTRRTTLVEVLGKDYFNLDDDAELGKFLGWEYGAGDLYTADTQLVNLYDDNTYYLYAAYENRKLTLEKRYLDEDGSYQYGSETLYVTRGTTYGELLEMLSAPSPDNANYTFTGWVNGSYYSADEVISGNYVYVYASYDKYPITVEKTYLDKNGERKTESINKEYPTGTTIKDVLADNQDTPKDASADYTITGWRCSGYDEDREISLSTNYIYIYAVCDKYPFTVNKTYLDKNGEVKTESTTKDYPDGTTIAEVLTSNEDLPEDASNDYAITGWRKNTYYYDKSEKISITYNNFSVIAAYEDHAIISVWGRYVDQNNRVSELDETIFGEVSDLKSTDAVAECINNTVQVSHAEEFGFQGWKVNYTNTDFDGNIYYASTIVDYEKTVVVLNYYYNNVSIAVAANPGDKITLPKTSNGWYSSYDDAYITDSFTVPADASGWVWLYTEDGYSEDSDNEPSVTPGPSGDSSDNNPGSDSGNTSGGNTDNNAGSASGGTSGTTPTTKPVVTMDEEKVKEVISDINRAVDNAESGTTPKVTVDMRKEDGSVATEVPKELLEAVQGKDVDLVLDMGGYTWTINGKDIKASDLKDINLEVTLDTEAIPPSLVSGLAGGQKTRQLSLTHNGDFGFKATLSLPLGAENAGQYGNLYYYDSNGKLVFMNAGQIDEDGTVSLTFSHASDYVIVIGENQANKATTSAQTGDVFPILPIAALCIGMGMVSISLAKRKRA